MRRFWMAGLGLMLVACSSSPSRYLGDAGLKHPADELWVNNSAEPEWIDPAKCVDTNGAELTLNLFEGLVQAHPETLLPMPGIAKSWEILEEGKKYIFHLRPSVWSDGKPLTAHDFVWSWIRALQPRMASPYLSLLTLLEGGEELHQGKIGERDFQGVQAQDDLTLVVRLVRPVPFFLDLLSFQTFMPVPRHVLERLSREGVSEEKWTEPAYIVSNGAFVLREWKFRQHIWFAKNPRYWDAASVRLNRVKVLEVEHPNTALNLYASGYMDWTGRNGSLPLEVLEKLETYEDFFRAPFLAVYFYWVNTQAKPLDQVKIRQALNLAINREELVKYILRAHQIPTADFVPDGLAGYAGPRSSLFDVKKAQSLLAEAGYPRGENFPGFTLSYNTHEGNKTLAEALAHMWKQNLGISVLLENQEWKVFLKNIHQMNFQVGRMGWFGDYPDPYTFLEIFSGDSPNNHSGWRNSQFDLLLREANRTSNRQERLRLFREAETILSRELPALSLYVYSRNFLKKPYLKGLWVNHLDRHPWKYMWIDAKEASS